MDEKFKNNLAIAASVAREAQEIMRPFFTLFQNAIRTLPEDFFEKIGKFAVALHELPERQRLAWRSAAVAGWYMNSQTGLSAIRYAESDTSTLDAFMSEHLIDDWDRIIRGIQEVSPARVDIIFTACKLHSEKNYIASVPLFLAQADGLFEEEFNEFLFASRSKFEESVQVRIEKADGFLFILLQVISQENQFRARVKHSTDDLKVLAPNRAGILHGSSKHLDYGTEINSLKAFSLLAFIALLVKCCRTPSEDE